MTGPPLTYRDAGIDIDRKARATRAALGAIRATFTPNVLSDIGLFGGLFRVDPAWKEPVLVATTDGVGTKLKVAVLAGRHDTVGRDLVNHCVNDALVQGAAPLFFLDYIGMSTVDESIVRALLEGCAGACRENGCALIGGETAELPDLYPPGEYDLVGFLVGVVERSRIVDGSAIRAGDRLLGLPSSGLHTNGYSLARKIAFERLRLSVSSRVERLGTTVGEALLRPHLSYLPAVTPLLGEVPVHGMAHITGGGFPDNIPRILPAGLRARVRKGSWPVPELFSWLVSAGDVPEEERYRVFNMGIGLVLALPPEALPRARSILKDRGFESFEIGEVVPGERGVDLLGP
ncbi:MAG TPA: phosphoribosylformylglycinamidine cyclo-ligase [Planctomycetota bacterium]|nr:phosphoribosylformylglycinamidine cyclo-ligase [Planctomycetota bacterium]